jgi:hypothetical protein
MATPPGFYNPVDQAIYSAGDFFIPQQRFRAAPYSVNNPAPDDPAASGLPAIYQSQGGGGGGGSYTGGISNLTGDFFQTTSDRQNRLTELNRPMGIIPGQRGDEIIMERLAPYGAPKDFYEGSIEGVPQTIKGAPGIFTREEPTLNRRIQDAFYSLPFLSKPQSADQIIAEGYTGQSNMPGIMSMILGSMDKYGNLPRGDQAFIARNMGYTGPTVFGENTSGLAKDPFGLNVRSAFGNYAERVGKEADKLSDLLTETQTAKYGKGTSGISFNAATNMFEAIDKNDPLAIDAALKATQMNKMNIAKLNFYKKQTIQRDIDRAAAIKAEELAAKKRREEIMKTQSYRNIASGDMGSDGQTPGGGGGNVTTKGGDTYGGATRGGYNEAAEKTDFYADGGIVDMLEIYD